MTVNQSEPSYSATKMYLFVLLALEKKVFFLAVLNLPFISWSWWSRLKVIWVACQMLWSSLMVIPVEMLLDKGESLQPTKKSAKALWLCHIKQLFFGPKITCCEVFKITWQSPLHHEYKWPISSCGVLPCKVFKTKSFVQVRLDNYIS